ncbi:MAG: TetR/AcrR family transcriptional regulator [bacterium]
MVDSKQQTRDELLETALDLFAQQGYRSTTVAQICDEADVNIASVNYHFGSKEGLYREVWRSRLDEELSNRPDDSNDFSELNPEDRLRKRIHLAVKRHLSLGEPGKFTSMIMHEMNNPTELVDTVIENFVSPIRQDFLEDVADLLRKDPEDRSVRFTVLSIFNQCFGLRFRDLSEESMVDFDTFDDSDVEQLADHIADFSISAIKRMRETSRNGASVE